MPGFEPKVGSEEALSVPTLGALLDHAPGVSEPFISKNPDVQYLGTKSGLPPAFLRRMVGYFKEPVVLEALRRTMPGWGADLFVGICRKVEADGKS